MIASVTKHKDWDFLGFVATTPPPTADFAMRAYGGRIGEIKTDGLNELRPKSWHWISSRIDRTVLSNRFQSLDYTVSQDTARQNSIGKGELVRLYSESFSHGALVNPVEKSTKK